jgi:hypothetical protein
MALLDRSVEFGLSMDGLPEAQRLLAQMDPHLRGRLKKEIRAIVADLVRTASSLAPVGSGPLKSKAQKRAGRHGNIPLHMSSKDISDKDKVGEYTRSGWFVSRFFEMGIDKVVRQRGFIRRRGNAASRALARYVRSEARMLQASSKSRMSKKKLSAALAKRGFTTSAIRYVYKRGQGASVDSFMIRKRLARRPHFSVAVARAMQETEPRLVQATLEALGGEGP